MVSEDSANAANVAAMAAVDAEVAAVLQLEMDNEAQEQAELEMKERVTADYNKTLIDSQKEACDKAAAAKQEMFAAIDKKSAKRTARRADLRQFLIGRRQAIGTMVQTPASTPGSVSSKSSATSGASSITPNKLDFGGSTPLNKQLTKALNKGQASDC